MVWTVECRGRESDRRYGRRGHSKQRWAGLRGRVDCFRASEGGLGVSGCLRSVWGVGRQHSETGCGPVLLRPSARCLQGFTGLPCLRQRRRSDGAPGGRRGRGRGRGQGLCVRCVCCVLYAVVIVVFARYEASSAGWPGCMLYPRRAGSMQAYFGRLQAWSSRTPLPLL